MKRTNFKKLILFSFAILFFASFFAGTKTLSFAKAEDKITIDSSKFLYSPSFSTIYNQKLYFIDNHDNNRYFKIFKTNNNEISYAESSEILNFEVIDVVISNNYFFVLTDNSIVYADLGKETIIFEKLIEIENTAFSSMFIYKSQAEFIITLTPSDFRLTKPIIIIQNFETQQTSKFKINDEYLRSECEKPNFRISNLATIKTSNNLYYYIYFGDQTISYANLQAFPQENYTQSESSSLINASALDTNPDISVEKINILDYEENNIRKQYFLITYKQETNASDISYYSKLYSFDFISNPKEFKSTDFAENYSKIDSSPFITTNGSSIVFEENTTTPQIKYYNISKNQTLDTYTYKNPTPTINKFSNTQYKVKSTNEQVYLIENPWDLSSKTIIPANTDILVVGTPLIKEIEVENLYHCLYTYVDDELNFVNKYGYIKSEFLIDKTTITLEDLNLAKTVKVFAGTPIYELPTKASTIKHEADGKFAVSIINTLNGYSTGSTKWIEVQLGGISGYVDISKINYSSGKINYISTNATIIKNNTYVYSQASKNSSLIYNTPLKEGKTVFVIGSRDTKTGFTKIKFNDEYGNEFEGFVKTENIKTDSWSQLQIIGSILIAINTGILILILVFKKKKIKQLENKRNNEIEHI